MSRVINIQPLSPPFAEEECDLLVGSVGFEERAWHIPSLLYKVATHRVAFGFASRKSHSFAQNHERFERAGFEIEDCDDASFPAWFDSVLARVADRDAAVRVVVDVSSMSRYRIATIVGTLFDRAGRRFNAKLLYSVGRYQRPPESALPIEVCAPVTAKFAGWWTEPEKPAVAVFGLGYEEERAVGAWEYIEPGAVWAFSPYGEDVRYDKALKRANRHLFEVLPRNRVIEYRVDKPFECFTTLEGLAYANMAGSRVILVPFGPKMFSVCCLLVACVHWPNIAVWRVSAGQSEPAMDRVASGKVIGIGAEFVG